MNHRQDDGRIQDLTAAHREYHQAREAILRMKGLLGSGRDVTGLLSALSLLQDADRETVIECGQIVMERGLLKRAMPCPCHLNENHSAHECPGQEQAR